MERRVQREMSVEGETASVEARLEQTGPSLPREAPSADRVVHSQIPIFFLLFLAQPSSVCSLPKLPAAPISMLSDGPRYLRETMDVRHACKAD